MSKVGRRPVSQPDCAGETWPDRRHRGGGQGAPRAAELGVSLYPLTFVVLLPAAPVLIGFAHANLVVRWMACLFLSALVTAGLFLFLQLAITLS